MKGICIKCSASWCGPCKALAPILEEISQMEEFKDIQFGEIDIEDPNNYEMSVKYQIRSVPTLLLMDEDGNLINKVIGLLPKNNLINVLKETYHV